jgi:hypothetical protein
MARVDRRQFFRIGGLASGIAGGLPAARSATPSTIAPIGR